MVPRYTFECITAAVLHLHGMGLVHHDLKSHNLVRFYDGRFRLIDFDQAKYAGKQDMGNTSIEITPPEVSIAKPDELACVGLVKCSCLN